MSRYLSLVSAVVFTLCRAAPAQRAREPLVTVEAAGHDVPLIGHRSAMLASAPDGKWEPRAHQ